MYSQPWSPTPSTTAVAPEFRTANRSPARPAANKLPGRGAIQSNIAQNHMLPTILRRKPTRTNHQPTTRQSFANKIVRLALQHQPHPLNRKRTKRLPSSSAQIERNIRRQITLRSPQRNSPASRAPTARSQFAIFDSTTKRQPSLNRCHRRHNPGLIQRRHRNRLIVPDAHPSSRLHPKPSPASAEDRDCRQT